MDWIGDTFLTIWAMCVKSWLAITPRWLWCNRTSPTELAPALLLWLAGALRALFPFDGADRTPLGPRGSHLSAPRRTIAGSRIELHGAGAVALQAVEHTDPDAVVGGRSSVALRGTTWSPPGRRRVARRRRIRLADRLECLWCAGGCRSHLDCSDPLFGRRLGAGAAPQGRGEVEPARVAAGAYHGRLGRVDKKVQPPGAAHGRGRPGNTPDGTGRAAIGEKAGFGAAVPNQRTAAAALARASTISMLMESAPPRVTVPAEVEFDWDAGVFDRRRDRAAGPDPGSTTFSRAVDFVTCDAHGDSSGQPASAHESDLFRRQ